MSSSRTSSETAPLFKWAWPQIKRKSVAGLGEWYKQKLMEEAFD